VSDLRAGGSGTIEIRRILLDGFSTEVVRHGDTLVAADGREVTVDDAQHLPPTVPSKIIAVHLNYASRTDEFMTKLPAAPTYFHKPVTAFPPPPPTSTNRSPLSTATAVRLCGPRVASGSTSRARS